MSKLKTNTIQHTGGSADNITLDNSQNVTAEGNLTVDGNLTVSGTSTISGYHPTTSRSNRNLVINGAMQIAQRGTSSTSAGYQTIDRIHGSFSNTDEAPTFSQVDIPAGTSPYNLPVGSGHPYAHGFRKCFQIQNGNQTSGAGTSDYIYLRYKMEAQDIANSGWNYLSASSYITVSYWVKSSVAQNFYGLLQTLDGTGQGYVWETGALTAHTWTKITKTIPGNSNLQFDNNTENGLEISPIRAFDGTDRTASMSLNTWGTYSSSSRTPDATSTWYTTNDATIQITGLQLEVGSVATDFEHRSYGDELLRCQRYCYIPEYDSSSGPYAFEYHQAYKAAQEFFPVTMRIAPTSTVTATSGSFTTLNTGTNHWKGYIAATGLDIRRIASAKFEAEL